MVDAVAAVEVALQLELAQFCGAIFEFMNVHNAVAAAKSRHVVAQIPLVVIIGAIVTVHCIVDAVRTALDTHTINVETVPFVRGSANTPRQVPNFGHAASSTAFPVQLALGVGSSSLLKSIPTFYVDYFILHTSLFTAETQSGAVPINILR